MAMVQVKHMNSFMWLFMIPNLSKYPDRLRTDYLFKRKYKKQNNDKGR